MAFDWCEYLSLARWLQTNTPPGVTDEAARRDAISRAYYAAFCYARNYARDFLWFSPRNDADDHGRLRAHLKQKRRHATAQSLDRLRQWRNECDYFDDVTFDLTLTAASAIKEADYVLQSLPPPAGASSAGTTSP
jgi:hypothetical protein